MRAAEVDDFDRRAQVKNAGRFGGRDFAHAVAQHRRGTDAARTQRRGDGALDGEDQRLRDAGQRQPILQGRR